VLTASILRSSWKGDRSSAMRPMENCQSRKNHELSARLDAKLVKKGWHCKLRCSNWGSI
jgi:hypothetical protein